jgi:uncharacterized membrane protein (Fun14 family)
MGDTAPWVALAAATLLGVALALAQARGLQANALSWLIIGLAAGWAYKRTGKVTASAVATFLIVWLVGWLGPGA